MAQSLNAGMGKFDPESFPGTVYEAFIDFVDSYAYEYEAITKPPPDGLSDALTTEWHQQNKRKQFLGRFASRSFQKDFEDSTTEAERITISFDDMVNKLKERYKPTRNTTLANFDFHKLHQREGESFDMFVSKVKHEANGCDFKCASNACTVRDVLIRDQIIIGTNQDEIKKNALNNQWGLADLVTKGRQLEAATHGAERIAALSMNNQTTHVHRVNHPPGKYSKKYKAREKMSSTFEQCSQCSSHRCKGGKLCVAAKMECFACGQKGHFKGAKLCKKTKKAPFHKRSTRRVVDTDSETPESSASSSGEENDHEDPKVDRIERNLTRQKCRYVSHVRRAPCNVKKRRTPRYQVKVIIKETEVAVFADTGADISVMSLALAQTLGIPLTKTKMRIKPYGSKPVKCAGFYIGSVMYNTTVANIRIYVIDKEVETLLSGLASEALGILTLNKPEESIRRMAVADKDIDRILKKYPSIFTGTGKLDNYQVKLHIDDNVQAIASPPRPVPFHLRERLRKEIQHMEEAGVIEDHHGPAPWISNIVLAPKDNGDVRVTVDMRKPNEAIQDTHIPIPRAEDIRAELAGCKYFSKLDFKAAFHQLELAPESRYITVFHDGSTLKRYTRLTMGTKPASGELNKALRPLFAAIPSAHVIHDDLVIATPTSADHNKALDEVFSIIKQSGMTLNPDKCIFKTEEVPFRGMIISKDGVKPDPKKMQALRDASEPRDKAEVMSFLCMLQANSDFIPNLSSETVHLRRLTEKNIRFKWTSQCQQEFQRLKELFHNKACLQYFDPQLHTYLFVDAHQSGLSAILSQGTSPENAHMVACASRATTPIERRYPQLDLEALSLDFALRRYRKYILGGPEITIFTDHKPLVNIFNSNRQGSIRTDRIKLRHQDVAFKVAWRAGKDNPADFISRHATPLAAIPPTWKEECGELEKTIWFLQFAPYTEAISMNKIITETKNDGSLQELRDCLKKGYLPRNKKSVQPYRHIFHQLTLSDEGLIMRGEQIVLPESLWKLAVEKAHQGGHPGMTNLKRRLRSHFWIQDLNQLVKEKAEQCLPCQLYTAKTTKEPISPQRTPQHAWEEVNIDLFGPMPDQRHILVVQDNLSRFPVAEVVPSTAAQPVLNALHDIYTNYGNPELHRTDNGPPFNSQAFTDFSEARGIQHTKVFPYHPQGNPAETFMKPLGKAVKAAFHNKEPVQRSVDHLLSAYRSTPHIATGIAPGNFLLRHGYRSDFPRNIMSETQITAARQHDAHQKGLRKAKTNDSTKRTTSTIQVGDAVFMKNMARRRKFDPLYKPNPLYVTKVDGKGAILTDGANTYRRHVDDIKPCHVPPTSMPTQHQHRTYWMHDTDNPTHPAENHPLPPTERPNSSEAADALPTQQVMLPTQQVMVPRGNTVQVNENTLHTTTPENEVTQDIPSVVTNPPPSLRQRLKRPTCIPIRLKDYALSTKKEGK